MLARSPLRLLPLAAVALATTATVASATGLDLNASTDGQVGISSGHATVTACAPTVRLEREHVYDDVAGRWRVTGFRVSGPDDLSDLCGGGELTLAVDHTDAAVSSPVVTTPVVVPTDATLMPSIELPSPIDADAVTGVAVLLDTSVEVRLTEEPGHG